MITARCTRRTFSRRSTLILFRWPATGGVCAITKCIWLRFVFASTQPTRRWSPDVCDTGLVGGRHVVLEHQVWDRYFRWRFNLKSTP